MDFESKTLSKTQLTQEQVFTSYQQINLQTLKEKLQTILYTLTEELEFEKAKFQQERDELMQSIRQKDQIIERLAVANSQLSFKNQMLQKTKLKENIQYKAKFFKMKEDYQKQQNHLFSVIKYLEAKNEELSHKLKSSQIATLKKASRVTGYTASTKYLNPDQSSSFVNGINMTSLSSQNLRQEKMIQNPIQINLNYGSRLNKAKSAKYLTTLFRTENSESTSRPLLDYRNSKYDFKTISPIKKKQDDFSLNPYEKRNKLNTVTKSSISDPTEPKSGQRKIASYMYL